MIRRNFVDMHKLAAEHDFYVDSDAVPDNLKCVQCKSVLRDARQVPCGCTFCRVCIDDMVAKGVSFCPGVSDSCGETLLSSSAPDYRANLNICRLLVRCTRVGCVYEGELASMEGHLQVCSRKSVQCLFHEFGCKRDKLPIEEIDAHFQQQNWGHSKILLEMIRSVTGELARLRSEEGARRDVETLKRELLAKERAIRSLADELRLTENENKSIRDEMKLMMDDVRHLKNENKLIRDEMRTIKKEKADLALQVEILSKRVNKDVDGKSEKSEINMADLLALVKGEITSFTTEATKSDPDQSGKDARPTAMNARSSGNEARSSGNEARSSGNDARSPGNEARSPGNEARSPGNEARSSGNEARSSGNEARSPGNEARSSGNEARSPGNEARSSGKDKPTEEGVKSPKLLPEPKETLRESCARQTSAASARGQPQLAVKTVVARPCVDRDIDTSFVWIINEDVGKTWQCIESEYFHGAAHPYRYRLALTTDGFFGASLDVHLRIYPGARDAQLSWPFRGVVTMTVGDTCRSTACRRLRQNCKIEKPARCLSTSSDEFSFSRPVLRQAGVNLHRGVRVSCDIIIDFG